MTAPTDRSMPRVAITSVMPEGHQHQRRALAQDVDGGAVELAVAHGDLDEPRADTVLRTISASRQKPGQNSRCFMIRVTPRSLGPRWP